MARRVLVIGGGGREHALAWKIAQSPKVEKVLVAPGNAGTAREPKCENVAVAAEDVDGLLRFAQQNKIDLTVVGPETPLVLGVVDKFRAAGLRIFGPTKDAAQLEGSKAFTKDFLARHQIPTAAYGNFTDVAAAEAYIKKVGAPIVVKADGLAAGKGVIIAQTVDEAHCRRARHAGGQRLRRGRPSRGGGGIPHRRGGQLHRDGGRRTHPAARDLAGSQARRRRRHRPQHRGHGRVLSRSRGDA